MPGLLEMCWSSISYHADIDHPHFHWGPIAIVIQSSLPSQFLLILQNCKKSMLQYNSWERNKTRYMTESGSVSLCFAWLYLALGYSSCKYCSQDRSGNLPTADMRINIPWHILQVEDLLGLRTWIALPLPRLQKTHQHLWILCLKNLHLKVQRRTWI